LATSSRKFEFVFRMFAVGDNAVPARGMGAIPEQLASRLPREQVRLLTRVETIQPGEVVLATGETLRAAAIVLAADGAEAARLTRCIPAPAWNSVTCLYFASDEPPVREPVLVLNATGKGPVNNLCVLSQVSPDYAPPGRSLISVTVLRGAGLADAQLVAAVLDHVREWFGSSVFKWRYLKTYRIPQAIPAQPPEALQPVERPCQIEPGVFVCSDHRHMASINGAP
jgi:phytoene dehydrogenase-like protein